MVGRGTPALGGVANAEYTVGDVMTAPLPVGTFDCVASIAPLHLLALAPALVRLGDLLRPGGLLLVLDLAQDHDLAALAAVAPAIVLGLWHTRRLRPPRGERQAWEAHGRTDRCPSLAEVRDACARFLLGARVQRHLFWRYSLVWRRP
jgi:SAM-dependent methyltransferase